MATKRSPAYANTHDEMQRLEALIERAAEKANQANSSVGFPPAGRTSGGLLYEAAYAEGATAVLRWIDGQDPAPLLVKLLELEA